MHGFVNVLHRALKSGKKVMVWGSAYDSLDEFKSIDGLMNRKYVYIYPDLTEEKLYELSKKASFFGVRGPITYKILERSNIDMSKVILSGDPGFLLKGKGKENPFGFKKKNKFVGINVGTSMNRIYGGDEERIFNELSKIANELIDSGYSIYLYSMWPKDTESILKFYKSLDKPHKVICDLENRKGEDLVDIIRECTFTINFKLHSNIISAVAGVPFVCLGYRLKCYDFAKSIECENLVVSTGSTKFYREVKRVIANIERNNEVISGKIIRKISSYKKILDKSLDNLI
ncbi:polysaccharide pyruvyl transferase family protein [Clostridium sp. B9]|uniref:polysaccharide pyruvyl transferase family protein n=1 Tax=Clostridium sp. B9 TaxID=3423224 RepID=UPI003D2F3FD8